MPFLGGNFDSSLLFHLLSLSFLPTTFVNGFSPYSHSLHLTASRSVQLLVLSVFIAALVSFSVHDTLITLYRSFHMTPSNLPR